MSQNSTGVWGPHLRPAPHDQATAFAHLSRQATRVLDMFGEIQPEQSPEFIGLRNALQQLSEGIGCSRDRFLDDLYWHDVQNMAEILKLELPLQPPLTSIEASGSCIRELVLHFRHPPIRQVTVFVRVISSRPLR